MRGPVAYRVSEHVANIGERGARRRRRGAVVWLIITAVTCALLLATGAPRWSRLVLALPIGFSAAGFLQARAKT
jgi:hypothetical protein